MHTMGIDIGTTTISVVLLDVDSGELIGRRTIEHRAFCKGILPEHPRQTQAFPFSSGINSAL